MEKIPLTTEQLRLWFEWKSNPNNYTYHRILQYKLVNTVDVNRLNLALSTAQAIAEDQATANSEVMRGSIDHEAANQQSYLDLGY